MSATLDLEAGADAMIVGYELYYEMCVIRAKDDNDSLECGGISQAERRVNGECSSYLVPC